MIDWSKTVLAPCQSVFGEPALFSPKTGDPFGVSVIFDNAYVEVKTSEYGEDITSVFPAIGVMASDFPNPPLQGDSVTITRTATTYKVREVRPDSHGDYFLPLSKG